jgi:hypothetical protein
MERSCYNIAYPVIGRRQEVDSLLGVGQAANNSYPYYLVCYVMNDTHVELRCLFEKT